MGKAVASVAPAGVDARPHAELVFVKQVAPTIEDLTAKAQPGPNR